MSYVSDQGVLNAQFNTEIVRCLPHVLMRPTLVQDGNAWLAIYGDLPSGVVGTGATPAEAMADFDAAWNRPAVTPPGYGLKRPADTSLAAKDAEIERLRKALTQCSDLIDNYYYEGDKEYQVVIVAHAALKGGAQ